jgi:hypothetical protein
MTPDMLRWATRVPQMTAGFCYTILQAHCSQSDGRKETLTSKAETLALAKTTHLWRLM